MLNKIITKNILVQPLQYYLLGINCYPPNIIKIIESMTQIMITSLENLRNQKKHSLKN